MFAILIVLHTYIRVSSMLTGWGLWRGALGADDQLLEPTVLSSAGVLPCPAVACMPRSSGATSFARVGCDCDGISGLMPYS